jgi:hypothetical protein
MRVTPLLVLAPLVIAAAAPALADDAMPDKLRGTWTQNKACKGDGSDPAKSLVKIEAAAVDSNFGPCALSGQKWDGTVFTANGACKLKSGGDMDIQVKFTVKDEKTMDFVEESSQYKSVLYRCPGK